MKKIVSRLTLAAAFAALCAHAQIPPTAAPNQASLLTSKDPTAAANKKLVYDMWRELLEGGHVELADKYLAVSYIQHNPNVPTGRQGFIDFFGKFSKPKPIEPTIKRSLINITAEGDIVILTFVQEYPEPKDGSKKYATTGVDMFRIEKGKIAEHWDSALKSGSIE